ncbi:MAG: VanZ family protein [Candidatus Stygibacter australis]|nr:VanZ family protein [Candidatus Stygibacter australis]MDP8323446.1 VanZ family protein [Candidatus Stygibacter australis]
MLMNKMTKWMTAIYYTWLAAILIVSSIPDIGSSEESLLGFDKYAHFIEYLILAFLFICMKLARHQKPILKNYFFLAVLLPALDELHQLFIRGRECSPLDFSADWAGVSLAFIVYLLLIKFLSIKL